MCSICADDDFEFNFLRRNYNINGMYIKTENENRASVKVANSLCLKKAKVKDRLCIQYYQKACITEQWNESLCSMV
jgi:hypothetical protein